MKEKDYIIKLNEQIRMIDNIKSDLEDRRRWNQIILFFLTGVIFGIVITFMIMI